MRRSMIACKLLTTFILVALLAIPGWAYQEGTVSDGGTIKGKVVYNGVVPTRKIIPTKDSDVCGGIRDQELILVGADKGVKDAIVFLKDVKKGKKWEKGKEKAEINNLKCRFEPHVQVAPVGARLEIINSDPVLHNTHGFYGTKTAFNVALPLKDARIKKPLRKPGIVRVDCDVHGWMRGWIYVADNPYHAITGKDGAFTLSDVPPGDYTLVTWQEHTGEIETPVTVKAKGTVNVNIELKK